MTAFQYREPKPPVTLMRDHIAEMRVYARDLQNFLGHDNPIVQRIYSCARSNELELDRWQESEAKWTGRECGPGSSELPSPVAASDAPKGDAP